MHSLRPDDTLQFSVCYFSKERILMNTENKELAKEMLELRCANSIKKWAEFALINPLLISFAKLT